MYREDTTNRAGASHPGYIEAEPSEQPEESTTAVLPQVSPVASGVTPYTASWPATGATSATSGPASTPSSMPSLSRADFLHAVLRNALGSNFLAPVTNPTTILDVGCGTGRWAYDMAREYPGAGVLGVDLKPPSSLPGEISGVTPVWPRNLSFQHGDLLAGLTLPPLTFDFVHMRLLYLAIPAQSWPTAVAELVRVTRHNGWVELVEGDLVRNGGPVLATYHNWTATLAARRGIDTLAGARIGDYLRTTALRQVTTYDFELPIGAHGGHFGEQLAEDFLARVEQMGALIQAAGIATPAEFRSFLPALRVEMANAQYSQPFHIAYGVR